MVVTKRKPIKLSSKKNRRFRFLQEPAKASAFIQLDEEIKKGLIESGAVPVNDIFFDLWNDQSKILLLYGGFGSGKSVFIVDMLLNKCLNDEYFRCFFGRKTFEAVRSSVFQTIIDRIKERGLGSYFSFSEADNSSMIIKCRMNGNYFHPFGSDNADKLKSVKDPSHIFCEELDQFSLADFGVLISRLRTSKTKTQFIGAFNTTKVKEGHWIKATFFDQSAALSQYSEYSITKRFCNYTDNYFIDQKEYEQTLWISAGFNEQKFREFAGGEWGADEKDNTFIYAMRKKEIPDRKPNYVHLVEGMEADYSLPLILSFDFNVEPIVCSAWQHALDLSWISGLQEYRLMNSDIFELCERIMSDHSNAFLKITGDASGRNRTAITRGNKNYFQIIKALLKVNSRQFVLPSKNPFHANTRVLANLLFAKHPALLLNKSMQYLIADIDNVEIDENGGIAKGKDKHKSHLLDTMLYYFWNFHRGFLNKYRIELPKSVSEGVGEVV